MGDFNKSLPTRFDVPSSSENKSTPVGTTSLNIDFSQDVVAVEIVNNSLSATIYLNINGGTANPATDMPIFPKSYYAIDRLVKQGEGISLISSIANTDVRIIGHFSLTPGE